MAEKTDLRVGLIMFGPSIVGGAEKRYANMYSAFRKNGSGMHLLINRIRFDTLVRMGLLEKNDPNISVCELPGDRVNSAIPRNAVSRTGMVRQSFLRQAASSVKLHLRYLRIWKIVGRWTRELRFDVLHGVFQGVYAMTPYFISHKVATVISYNASSLTQLQTTRLKWFIGYRFGLQRCDQIDFLSNFVKDNVGKSGISFDSAVASVSPCSFIDYSKCIPAPVKEKAVAFCGRLIDYKNPLLFISAVKEVAALDPDVSFYVMGTGPLEGEIRYRVDRAGLGERIRIGFEESPEEVLAKTMIFVSLQETNNYPSQSLLEAMACGNAVVATDVGETELLVDDGVGIRIKKNKDALVGALMAFLNDPASTIELGRNARRKVLQEHSLERFSGYMCGVYRDAVKHWEMKE